MTFLVRRDFPEALSTHGIKGLGQIDVGRVQVNNLFLTLLLKLSSSKDHVDSPAFSTEAALALRWETLF